MKVRFLQDYRGVLTGERFYRKGDVVDVADADGLVAAGRAELVEPGPAPEKPKPAPRKSRSKT